MKVHVFKTDIKSKKEIKSLGTLFNHNSSIYKWTVDTEDIDNVLRIVSSGNISDQDLINQIQPFGFHCEVLPD